MTDIAPATVAARPLITMAIRHFNNAPFVAEALAGAFAQTYSPLEIVFIDDASTDGGDKVAERLIREYRGPHRTMFARNSCRLGVGSQLGRVQELSHGEIIVLADADDVSVPERCEQVFEAFRNGGSDLLGVLNRFELIGRDGRRLENLPEILVPSSIKVSDWTPETLARERTGPTGAVMAFRRRILECGTSLDGLTHSEDLICGFRCVLLGRIIEIPAVLVKRRVHLANLSGPISPTWQGIDLANWTAGAVAAKILIPRVMRRDLDLFEQQGLIAADQAKPLRRAVAALVRHDKLLRILPRLSLFRACLAYFELRRFGLTPRVSLRTIMQARMPTLAMVFLRRNALIRTRSG